MPVLELIGSQQRLTTAWLLSGVLREYNTRSKTLAYFLEYQSRPQSTEYLNELIAQDAPPQNHATNIDYWYMSQAVKAMREWAADEEGAATLLEFLRTRVMVLKHIDAHDVDPAAHFVSLNSGRIPL